VFGNRYAVSNNVWITLTGSSALLTPLTAVNPPGAQFIFSATDAANIEHHPALIQQLLQQNMLLVGCRPLSLMCDGKSSDVKTENVNCVHATETN